MPPDPLLPAALCYEPIASVAKRQKMLRVAQLVAEGESIAEISRQLGVSPPTITSWSRFPEFQEEVEKICREAGEVYSQRAIAKRLSRVKFLDERHEKLRRIIDERGAAYLADPATKDIPGVGTGLLIVSNNGAVRLDVAILREMRELEKRAAIEFGQWAEDAGEKKECSSVVVLAGFDEHEALGLPPLVDPPGCQPNS
jgi:hypothetical protein